MREFFITINGVKRRVLAGSARVAVQREIGYYLAAKSAIRQSRLRFVVAVDPGKVVRQYGDVVSDQETGEPRLRFLGGYLKKAEVAPGMLPIKQARALYRQKLAEWRNAKERSES